MKIEEKYVDDARYLLNEFGTEKITFYDDDSLVHTVEDGVIEVSTMYSDYTTYHVSMQAGALMVGKKYADRGKTVSGPMSDEDYEELATQLACFASRIRTEKALKQTDMQAIGSKVLDMLFSDPSLGPRPARGLTLETGSYRIAQAINDVLEEAGRQVEFEWKEWRDEVHAVNRIGALQALGIALAPPTEQEQRAVAEGDFTEGILGWFHAGLAPHGVTMIALAPLDELQKFSIVSISNFHALQKTLKQLNVRMAAAKALLKK